MQHGKFVERTNNISIFFVGESNTNKGENLMKRIIDAETEFAQEMINQWKEDEMNKIKSSKNKK